MAGVDHFLVYMQTAENTTACIYTTPGALRAPNVVYKKCCIFLNSLHIHRGGIPITTTSINRRPFFFHYFFVFEGPATELKYTSPKYCTRTHELQGWQNPKHITSHRYTLGKLLPNSRNAYLQIYLKYTCIRHHFAAGADGDRRMVYS